jgi:hypothetical protein
MHYICILPYWFIINIYLFVLEILASLFYCFSMPSLSCYIFVINWKFSRWIEGANTKTKKQRVNLWRSKYYWVVRAYRRTFEPGWVLEEQFKAAANMTKFHQKRSLVNIVYSLTLLFLRHVNLVVMAFFFIFLSLYSWIWARNVPLIWLIIYSSSSFYLVIWHPTHLVLRARKLIFATSDTHFSLWFLALFKNFKFKKTWWDWTTAWCEAFQGKIWRQAWIQIFYPRQKLEEEEEEHK